MYVCICNAVTESEIRRAVREGANCLNQLQRELGVAGCCGSCRPHAQECLEECLAEQLCEAEPAAA